MLLASNLEQGLDVVCNLGSGVVAGVPLDQVSVLIKQELLEVPGDIGTGHRGPSGDASAIEASTRKDQSVVVVASIALGVSLRILGDLDGVADLLEQRMRTSPVDSHLGIEVSGELETIARSDILQRVEDIVVVLIRLMAELVAEHTNAGHSSGLGNIIHCREVRCGRASQRRDILQKDNFALVRVELDILARKVLQRVIV